MSEGTVSPVAQFISKLGNMYVRLIISNFHPDDDDLVLLCHILFHLPFSPARILSPVLSCL